MRKEKKATINYSWWRNPGTKKWAYDIRKGDVLRGKILASGKGFDTKSAAQKDLRKKLKRY